MKTRISSRVMITSPLQHLTLESVRKRLHSFEEIREYTSKHMLDGSSCVFSPLIKCGDLLILVTVF